MSFAVPAALMLAAIALPIIALYILKVRLRRVRVSTNLFWKQVYEEKPPRSLWQNLRHLISLLAQLLLLLLLVLAAADPTFSWQALQSRRLVVVLDTSASMKATDINPSRFEAARVAVHRLLDGLRFRDEVAIVSAGYQPEVVLGMASHTPTLRRAVDSVQPTDCSSALETAIKLAKQLIGEHPNGQVLVFSDGCAQRPDDVVTPNNVVMTNHSEIKSPIVNQPENTVQVIHHTFATDASNVGIIQFQARRSLIDPIGYEVFVTLRNASQVPVRGRLELELEQIPIDVIPFDLKPNETWTRSVEKTSLEGGVLRGTLTQLAATESQNSTLINTLPIDDSAWALVPPRQVQDVLIVSPGNLFLRKVFEANPLVNVTLAKKLPKEWPAKAVVVLHRMIPEKLPPGQVLAIDPESDSDAWTLGDTIESPIITEQDQESPLMTHLRLDNVLLPQARRINFSQPSTALAATVTGEAVYAVLNRSDGPCLVLSVNLDQSDLAFRTSFPIMMTNALSWFAGQPDELQPSLAGGHFGKLNPASSQPLLTGLSVTDIDSGQLSTSESAQTQNQNIRVLGYRLLSPAGNESPIVSQQVGPLNSIGIWRVVRSMSDSETSKTESVQLFAVNLSNAQETDLRPVEGTLAAAVGESDLANVWFSRPIWFYLTAIACLLCAMEWFLCQRRVIS